MGAESFEVFAAAHVRPLHRAAFLLCGDWHIAEDLVQQTLTDAYVNWHRVRRADSPEAYLHRILVNNVRSRWRRRTNREHARHDLSDERLQRDPAQIVVDRDEVLRGLLNLPARQRAAVVLRHIVGLSETDTAEALGVSVGTVKSSTSRALVALRATLTEETCT